MDWEIRIPNETRCAEHYSMDYGDNCEFYTIKLHYSGRFIKEDAMIYYNEGRHCYVDNCCEDKMSLLELNHMATEVGISGNLQFYYSPGAVDDCSSLVHIQSDRDTLELSKSCGEQRMVGIFIHPEIVDFNNLANASSSRIENELPSIDEPLNFMGFYEEDSDESEGEVSIGEDSVYSELMYDSEGQYFDDDFKANESVGPELKISTLKGKGKQLAFITPNEKFGSYAGNGKTDSYERCKVFNPLTDMKKVELEYEMCFTSVDIFRKAVRKHAVDEARTLVFPTNNPKRVQVKCKDDNCSFYVFASKVPDDNTFQIKSIHFEHDCIRQPGTVQGDTRFLSNMYADKLRNNPKWSAKAMLAETTNDCKIKFSKYQMWRTKKKVYRMDHGEDSEQFSILKSYGKELLRANPGSTVKIKVKTRGNVSHFKRMYICFAALKRGMLSGCRKVILLDGCHVRTTFGGIILTAIGIDSNNAMYPFAYAVVEKETKKSWNWFLDLVKSDLDITICEDWTLMSDKQKGLLDAVDKKFKGCEHRFCVMHLYSNFKLKHKGLTLKDLLWRAARATRIVDFERAMEELRVTDQKAYDWLMKRPADNWSKSHFKTTSKSDIVVNNLSESFNGAIAKMRMLPILHMLESIRLKLMEKIGEKKMKMMRYRGTFCPRIVKIFEENMKRSHEYTPRFNGDQEFNVQKSEFGSSYVVHLRERYCSCRRWQLTGIPCAHAICGLNALSYKAENYIDECYTKETYLRIYDNYIMPIASVEEWPEQSDDEFPIVPPIVEKQPGRPKEYKRKLQQGEIKGKIIQPVDKKFGKKSKVGVSMTCSWCSTIGHNKKGCPTKDKNLDIPAANKKKKQINVEVNVEKDGPSAKTSKPPATKKKKIALEVNSTSSQPTIETTRPKKLQVKRKVESWLECSQGNSGVSYSQSELSGFGSSQHVNLSSSQHVNYSRHVGDVSFSKKPAGANKSYKSVRVEEEPLFKGF